MIPLSARQRHILLGSGLALTLALVFWPSNDPEERKEVAESDTAQEARPPASGTRPSPERAGDAAGGLRLGRAERTGEPGEIRNIFAKQSWYVAPPAVAKAPELPPLPFTYLGKLIDDGRVTVYLADQNRNIAVRQGDVIDGTYRVKRISPPVMTFVYLPMNKQQTLDIGRAN